MAALGLPRGKLHGIDAKASAKEKASPVIIKFTSAEGDAHATAYGGEYRGVLLTPSLPDVQIRQFGYLPLELWADVAAPAATKQ